MATVQCVDGSQLSALPVPVLARDGVPYEVTLRLERDGHAFGEVGERCGWFVAVALEQLRAARALDDEGFPLSSVETAVRTWATGVALDADRTWDELARHLPRDRELFAFRARDPDDLRVVGELRVALQVERTWIDGAWDLRCLAVLEAWGAGGDGVRAVLTSAQLQEFLEQLVADFAAVGAAYDPKDAAPG